MKESGNKIKHMLSYFSTVREQLEHIECCLGADEERVESLWVRIKGQAHVGDTVVAVYYRPPDQEEGVDKAFCRQLKGAA